MNARSPHQSIGEMVVSLSPWTKVLYSHPKGPKRPNIPKADFLAAFGPLMPVEGRKSDGLVPRSRPDAPIWAAPEWKQSLPWDTDLASWMHEGVSPGTGQVPHCSRRQAVLHHAPRKN